MSKARTLSKFSANVVYTGTLTGSANVVNIGSGQIYKDATGNVGINTTTPVYTLDILGNTRTTNLISQTATINGVELGAYSNAAFAKANTVSANSASASSYANTGITLAQAAYNAQNSTATIANTKFNTSGGTITGSVIINTDLTVSGNVYISGNTTTLDSTNMNIADSLIYMAQGNPTNSNDIGLVGHFTSDHYQHTGIVRDHTDATWKFFSNVSSEPTTSINFLEANTIYDNVKVGGLTYTGTLTGSSNTINIGSGQLYKDTSGNIGIGTSSPASKLDIGSGNLNFSGTAQRITGDFSNATISNRVAFQTTTANTQTVVTVIPNGTSATATISLESDPLLTNSTYLQVSSSAAGSGTTGFYSGIRGTGTYSPMTFFTGGSERMRIDSSGNVGIGTSSPATKAEIGGVLKVWTGATGALGAIALGDNGTTAYNCGIYRGAAGSVSTAGNFLNIGGYDGIVFTVSNAAFGSQSERMRIDTSGNVGIGGTSTASVNRLDVVATAADGRIACRTQNTGGNSTVEAQVNSYWTTPTYTGTAIVQYDSAATGTQVGLSNSNLGVLRFQNGSAGLIYTNGSTPIVFGTAGTERLRIDSNGNVGIGTTAAGLKLDVRSTTQTDSLGIIRAYNTTAAAAGAGGVNASVYAQNNNYGVQMMAWENYGARIGNRTVASGATGGSLYLTYGNDTVGMTIDSAGRVTYSNNPAFITAAQSGGVTYASGTKVNYNTNTYNRGSGWNSTNNYFVAPVAGYYFFKAQLWTYTGQPGNAWFKVNGVNRYGSFGNEAQNIGFNGYALVEIFYLSANDYVEVYNRSGTVYTDSSFSTFSGYLIG